MKSSEYRQKYKISSMIPYSCPVISANRRAKSIGQYQYFPEDTHDASFRLAAVSARHQSCYVIPIHVESSRRRLESSHKALATREETDYLPQ